LDWMRMSVAVCVTGMPERLQPEHLIKRFVAPNAARFAFDIIYALAPPTSLFYSTDGHVKYDPSSFAQQTHAQLTQSLAKLVSGFPERHVRLHVLRAINDLDAAALRKKLSISPVQALDRISQFIGNIQPRILNMYHHQEICAQQIGEIERGRGRVFDFVVSTREDVYLWKDMNLEELTSRHTCDIVTKDCKNWGGINMRLQLLRRDSGLRFLRDRLPFYAAMYRENRTFANPEVFELAQAEALKLSVCYRSIDNVPVTAVRHTQHGEFCFPKFEVFNIAGEGSCMPKDHAQFTMRSFCNEVQAAMLALQRGSS